MDKFMNKAGLARKVLAEGNLRRNEPRAYLRKEQSRQKETGSWPFGRAVVGPDWLEQSLYKR